jgi:hypothetical protein
VTSIALAAGVLVVYLRTLAPGPLGGDAGEFQTAARVWGLSHPTGYPLYMLLLKTWSLLPVGTVAYRINLLSAVLAAASVGLFYVTLQAVTRETLAATVAALALGFSPLFWSQALIADKYILNALLITGVLATAIYWAQRPQRQRLCLLALAYGLSLTHHRTMILFAPGLLGFVLGVDPTIYKSRRNGLALLCLILPLGLYAYLPLTRAWGHPLSNWWPSTPGEWLSYLFARGHLSELQTIVAPLPERMALYGRTLAQQFTIWGLFLAGLGCLRLILYQRSLAFLTLVSFGLQGFLSMAYYYDPQNLSFFLPSFLLVVFWAGIGGTTLLQWSRKRLSERGKAQAIVVTIIGLSLCLLPTFLLVNAYPEMYRRHHEHDRPLDIWRQDLTQGQQATRLALDGLSHVAPDGIIVCDWEQTTSFRYFQEVEKRSTSVQIVYPIERLDEAATSGQPLYIARSYPGLADCWHPSCSGPLIALHSAPVVEPPPGISPVHIQLGDFFELLGFDYGQAEFTPATVVPLTLYWQAIQVPEDNFSVSLRLYDETGQQVFKVDSQHPVLGTYPTSLWAAGEVVNDYYEIPLSSNLPPGEYCWGVILYRSLPEGGWENLKIAGTDDELAMGDTITVKP